MENKKPRFFCENCNAEVKRDARFCNKCGHFFASVKCPACGKVGSASIFKNGCPVCGYAVGDSDTSACTQKDKTSVKTSTQIKNTFKIGKKAKGNIRSKEDSLPFWMYALTTIVLVVVVLMFCYLNGII